VCVRACVWGENVAVRWDISFLLLILLLLFSLLNRHLYLFIALGEFLYDLDPTNRWRWSCYVFFSSLWSFFFSTHVRRRFSPFFFSSLNVPVVFFLLFPLIILESLCVSELSFWPNYFIKWLPFIFFSLSFSFTSSACMCAAGAVNCVRVCVCVSSASGHSLSWVYFRLEIKTFILIDFKYENSSLFYYWSITCKTQWVM